MSDTKRPNLPRGMAAKQHDIRTARADPHFDLLAHIMSRYNDEGAVLDDIAAELGVSISTLYTWLGQCAVRIDKQMVQAGVAPAEEQ